MIGAVLVCTALSWANSPTPPPACPTIGCDGTAAHGSDAVAVGFATNARGLNAVAMGFSTTAKGNIATAMGSNTTASGDFATAMGWSTVAECGGAEPSTSRTAWPRPGVSTGPWAPPLWAAYPGWGQAPQQQRVAVQFVAVRSLPCYCEGIADGCLCIRFVCGIWNKLFCIIP